MALATSAFANQGRVQNVFNAETVETTNTVTSDIFLVRSGGYFGAWVDLDTGIGTPDVDVTCQMSYTTDANSFATPTSMSLVLDDSTSLDPQIITVAPTPMQYMRFIAYGNTANTTGTTITMYLFSQD